MINTSSTSGERPGMPLLRVLELGKDARPAVLCLYLQQIVLYIMSIVNYPLWIAFLHTRTTSRSCFTTAFFRPPGLTGCLIKSRRLLLLELINPNAKLSLADFCLRSVLRSWALAPHWTRSIGGVGSFPFGRNSTFVTTHYTWEL